MRLIRRVKSSSRQQVKKLGSSAPLTQNGEKKADAGGVGSNSRQVAPDIVVAVAEMDDGTSRDETFFEACPWLESDCEDDFYSVTGDLTPARSFRSQNSRITPFGPPKLPTLGSILKDEPLKPSTPQKKLADLLRETQEEEEDDDSAVGGSGDLSRADSLRLDEEANRCCVPQFARAISCNGRRRHHK